MLFLPQFFWHSVTELFKEPADVFQFGFPFIGVDGEKFPQTFAADTETFKVKVLKERDKPYFKLVSEVISHVVTA